MLHVVVKKNTKNKKKLTCNIYSHKFWASMWQKGEHPKWWLYKLHTCYISYRKV